MVFVCVIQSQRSLLTNEVFLLRQTVRVEERTEMVSEGPNPNYWFATATNAISPLHKLIAMAQLRPDGIWIGD